MYFIGIIMTFYTYRHIKAYQKGLPDLANGGEVPLNNLAGQANGTNVNNHNVTAPEGFVPFAGKGVKI